VSGALPAHWPIPRKGAGVVTAKPSGKAFASDVMRSSLSRTAREVWTSLCNHVNADGFAWPCVATIARECAISERTAQRGLAELREQNWVCAPEGHAGGRQRAVKYHLHRNGKPCSFGSQEKVKMQTAGPAGKVKRGGGREGKGDIVSPFTSNETVTETPEKGDNLSVKGDKNDGAYKEEPSVRTISNGTSSTTTGKALAFEPSPFLCDAWDCSAREHAVDEHDYFKKKLKHPGTEWWFNRLENLLHKPGKAPNEPSALGSKGRLRIMQAGEKHGFSLGEFYFAFKEHRGGLSQSGGLIHFAEDWPVSILGICNWPACYYCVDSGVIEYPDSPFEKEVPCQCEAGKRKLESEKFAGFDVWLQARKEGRFYCHDCCNTGVLRDMPGASFDFPERQFCLCELGRHKLGEWHKRKREADEAEVAARAQAREHGICEICFARDPGRGTCVRCNSTGRHFTEEELSTLCSECKGLRKLKYYKDKECSRCKGTGQARIRQLAY
jgi:hypothetical protein